MHPERAKQRRKWTKFDPENFLATSSPTPVQSEGDNGVPEARSRPQIPKNIEVEQSLAIDGPQGTCPNSWAAGLRVGGKYTVSARVSLMVDFDSGSHGT